MSGEMVAGALLGMVLVGSLATIVAVRFKWIVNPRFPMRISWILIFTMVAAFCVARLSTGVKADVCDVDAEYWASQAIVCGRAVEELSADEVKGCKKLASQLDSLDAYLKANNCNLFVK